MKKDLSSHAELKDLETGIVVPVAETHGVGSIERLPAPSTVRAETPDQESGCIVGLGLPRRPRGIWADSLRSYAWSSNRHFSSDRPRWGYLEPCAGTSFS